MSGVGRWRWSETDDTALRAARTAGEQYQAIAVRLGRSVMVVQTRMVVLGLTEDSGRPWNSEEDHHLAEGWARGETSRAIAAHWLFAARIDAEVPHNPTKEDSPHDRHHRLAQAQIRAHERRRCSAWTPQPTDQFR